MNPAPAVLGGSPLAGREADVLIVGSGIAGSAAAYFAARRGRRCMIVDAAIECASTVPTALINPVRGYLAKHSAEDVTGARFTFDLIEDLRRAGHPVVGGRGLWRPVPEPAQRDQWAASLSKAIAHRWSDGASLTGVLQGTWVAALHLPDSGWVDTGSLLRALRSEARAQIVTAEVARVDAQDQSVQFADGTRIGARTLLWCGGAWGASRIASKARFRPGSVFLTAERVFPEALSYGLYAAPHGSGSVIGPTTEAQYANYPADWEGKGPLERLIERARSLLVQELTIESSWRGVRLESATLPRGLASLGRFGSRGYLLAPRAAAEWAARL